MSFDASAIFLELEPDKPPLFNYAQANEFGETIWLLSDGLTSRLLTTIGSRTKSLTRPIYYLMKHGRAYMKALQKVGKRVKTTAIEVNPNGTSRLKLQTPKYSIVKFKK